MAVDYKKKIGFKGTLLIEPKPKEPTKHQYDFDAATVMGFLRKYGLENEYKLNIEANHATLAQHTFQHELNMCRINGMLGSVDANMGDYLLGWDTDQFPTNIYDTTLLSFLLILLVLQYILVLNFSLLLNSILVQVNLHNGLHEDVL